MNEQQVYVVHLQVAQTFIKLREDINVPQMRIPNFGGDKKFFALDAAIAERVPDGALVLIHPRRINMRIPERECLFDNLLALPTS